MSLVHRDKVLDGCRVTLHCHCLVVDANGRVNVNKLSAFMRAMATDYAIPRQKIAEAKARDAKFSSTGAVNQIHAEALSLFTDLKNTGEGGEILLYLLAERFLKMPQVLCKMDLKTSTSMHYHGADGVYARVKDNDVLKLYWGESKIYGDVTDAVRDCLNSLAPFLLEPESEDAKRARDLILLSDKADLNDSKLTAAFRKYFDKTNPKSNRVQYCGVALIGFDVDFYPANGVKTVADEINKAAATAIEDWGKKVGNRIKAEKLESFEIEFLCVPLPSVEFFRKSFLAALGHKK